MNKRAFLEESGGVEEIAAVEALMPETTEVAIIKEAKPPVIMDEQARVMSLMMDLARDPSVDVAKLQALVGMQQNMEDRTAERAFNAAFVKMQGQLPIVTRQGKLEYPDAKEPSKKKFISNYARWEDIDKAISPILAEHGFSLTFKIAQRGDGGGLLVSAVIRHSLGHTVTGDPFPVPLDTSGGKNNIQAYGSALSYGKRYAATAALGIKTQGEDDDGRIGGMTFVTADQATQLREMAEQTNTDEEHFLGMMTNVAQTFEQVALVDFPRLINALTTKHMRSASKKKGDGA